MQASLSCFFRRRRREQFTLTESPSGASSSVSTESATDTTADTTASSSASVSSQCTTWPQSSTSELLHICADPGDCSLALVSLIREGKNCLAVLWPCQPRLAS